MVEMDIVTIPVNDYGFVLRIKPERAERWADGALPFAADRIGRVIRWTRKRFEKQTGLVTGEPKFYFRYDPGDPSIVPTIGWKWRAVKLPDDTPREKIQAAIGFDSLPPTAKKEIRWLRSLPKLQVV